MTGKVCLLCQKIFTTNANLKFHMNRKKPCVMSEMMDDELVELPKNFKCNRCEMSFLTNYKLMSHLNRKFPCILKKNKSEEGSRVDEGSKSDECSNSKEVECSNSRPEEIVMRDMFERLQQENESLKEQLEIKTTIPNINNHSNNTTHITNNVSVNVYGKEDMSHMTDAMYIRCCRQMQKSIETLFRMKHFSNQMESNQNLYITNLRDAYMMLYNGKNWNKVNRLKTLTDIYYTLKDDLLGIVETMREKKTIDAELDKHFKWFIEEELSEEMEERFVKASCETMACTAYNNRHLPMKIKTQMEKERRQAKY